MATVWVLKIGTQQLFWLIWECAIGNHELDNPLWNSNQHKPTPGILPLGHGHPNEITLTYYAQRISPTLGCLMWLKHVKTINHPPVITISIGAMFTIPIHGWLKWHCFTHINHHSLVIINHLYQSSLTTTINSHVMVMTACFNHIGMWNGKIPKPFWIKCWFYHSQMFIMFIYSPDDPCMEYLPTSATKVTQFCR